MGFTCSGTASTQARRRDASCADLGGSYGRVHFFSSWGQLRITVTGVSDESETGCRAARAARVVPGLTSPVH